MKRVLVVLGIVAILVVVFGVGLVASNVPEPAPVPIAQVEQPQPPTVEQEPKTEQLENTPVTIDELHALVNAERGKAGLTPLTLDSRLNQSAKLKADDMEATGLYEHTNTHGEDSSRFYKEAGIFTACITGSENLLGNDRGSASASVAAWMGSPSHRDAILAGYELVGYAITDNYIVQHFCDLG